MSLYVAVEQENDLLVCGDCQTSFPLQDIVQFIKHKNHNCNKENVESGCSPSADDASQDDGEGPKDLSNPKASGGKKDAAADWPQGERGTPSSRDGASSVQSVEMREEGREQRMPLRPKQVVDAEANTTHSGKEEGRGFVLNESLLENLIGYNTKCTGEGGG